MNEIERKKLVDSLKAAYVASLAAADSLSVAAKAAEKTVRGAEEALDIANRARDVARDAFEAANESARIAYELARKTSGALVESSEVSGLKKKVSLLFRNPAKTRQ